MSKYVTGRQLDSVGEVEVYSNLDPKCDDAVNFLSIVNSYYIDDGETKIWHNGALDVSI